MNAKVPRMRRWLPRPRHPGRWALGRQLAGRPVCGGRVDVRLHFRRVQPVLRQNAYLEHQSSSRIRQHAAVGQQLHPDDEDAGRCLDPVLTRPRLSGGSAGHVGPRRHGFGLGRHVDRLHNRPHQWQRAVPTQRRGALGSAGIHQRRVCSCRSCGGGGAFPLERAHPKPSAFGGGSTGKMCGALHVLAVWRPVGWNSGRAICRLLLCYGKHV